MILYDFEIIILDFANIRTRWKAYGGKQIACPALVVFSANEAKIIMASEVQAPSLVQVW